MKERLWGCRCSTPHCLRRNTMKSQIIQQRILTAEEGFYLTDGNTYGKTVVLPVTADPSVWREVTEAQLPKEETP